LKINRLIKSEIYDAFKKSNNYYEVFKNPSQSEIDLIWKQDNCIRGVIDKNGDKYIWDGYVIDHFHVNSFLENKVPTNYFRFVYDGKWMFDLAYLGADISREEFKKILENNLNFLDKIGDINAEMSAFGFSNGERGILYITLNDFLNKELVEAGRLKKANLPILQNYYDISDYDLIDIGIKNINVSDIIGLGDGRVDEYNDDWSPKNPNDARWLRLYEGYKNGDKIDPIPLTETPDGKFFPSSDGNHRVSVVKTLNLSNVPAKITKMVHKDKNVNSSWEEYAKEKIEKLNKMSQEYQSMFPKFNELLDKSFDDVKFKKEYKEFKRKMDELGNKIGDLDRELQDEEKKFKNEKLLVNSRLIKSEFYDGYKDKYDSYYEIFKNPTSSEIESARKKETFKSIRGIIEDDGTMYVWGGSLLHDENPKINRNAFRFSVDYRRWFFDAHYNYSFNEIINLIIKYESKLSQIRNLNDTPIEIYYTTDSVGHEGKTFYSIDDLKKQELLQTSRLAKNKEYDPFGVHVNPISFLYPGYYPEELEEDNFKEDEENE